MTNSLTLVRQLDTSNASHSRRGKPKLKSRRLRRQEMRDARTAKPSKK